MITVETTIQAPIEKVWEYFTAPIHVTKWYHASDDWHAPFAENDLRAGGKFKTTMAAKDGSFSFDFEGTYQSIKEYEQLNYILDNGRKINIIFTKVDLGVKITESFDPENQNSPELQRSGWQSILNNFKLYVEAKKLNPEEWL